MCLATVFVAIGILNHVTVKIASIGGTARVVINKKLNRIEKISVLFFNQPTRF